MKELAKVANVSIPTARSRLQRLMDLGVVKPTVVVDSSKIVGGIAALVRLKTRSTDVQNIVENLEKMEEVDAIYKLTGEHDLLLRVSLPDIRSLDDFITNKLSQIQGLENIKTDIIVNTLKESYGFILRPGFGIRLYCDLCKKQITNKAVRRTIQGREYFFCCETCANTFRSS